MPTAQAKVTIELPARQVIAHLARPERSPEWIPYLVRVERTSRAKTGAGVKTIVVAQMGGKESKGTGRYVEWDPPRRLVIESAFDTGVTSKTSFDLEENGSKTQL